MSTAISLVLRPRTTSFLSVVASTGGSVGDLGTRLHLHGLLKVRKRLHDFIFVPSQPSALQLVLLIPEGTDIVTLPSLRRGPRSERTNTGEVGGVPNCYLVCKLFCATPHPTTPVQWASSNPQFQFRQVTNCVPV